MNKKQILIPTLLLIIAGSMIFYAYAERSVASFLWGLSFIFISIASTTVFFRNTLITLTSLLITFAIAESALGYMPTLFLKGSDNKGGGIKQDIPYFSSGQTYNTPAYWRLGQFGSQPQSGIFTANKLAGNGEVIYDTIFTIGSDGFRVTPQYEVKQKHRINFFGDSFTFGEGVADDQTMAYFVGDLVNKQQSQKFSPLQVKNYGIHGWGVHQSLAILQGNLETKADIQFVLTAPWHASRAACADSFSLGSPKYKLDTSGLVSRDGYCRSFAWVEHSPKALRGLITSSKIYNLIQDSLLVTYDQDKQIEIYLGILKAIQAQVKSRDEQLIVGFIKADDQWFVGTYNNDKLVAKMKNDGIRVIDMTLADKNELLERKYYLHEQDKHPTGEANFARSKLLVSRLPQ